MVERILVVEDESTLCANIARALTRAGHTVTATETGAAALRELGLHSFDLVITDLRLPDSDGLTILDHVRRSSPETVVLIMTAYASVDSAVEALRRGAHDFILKPMSLADLQTKVEHIAAYHRLGSENAQLRTMLRGESEPLELLRRGCAGMQALCELIEKVAPSSSSVLIRGESGSGKELVARALHDQSLRKDGPFVSLNVSAMPEALVESMLFGHERGAFSGADRKRDGMFRAASGGTLFLDEIGELAPAAQAKVLRAVELKEIFPVGSDRGIKVDVRIVAATHRDLGEMATTGQFRADLLYRLKVVQLEVPPLRERREDVPSLAITLTARHAREQKRKTPAIEAEALRRLAGYAWPGNVRELSNVMERAVLLCDGATITTADLPRELRPVEPLPPLAVAAVSAGAQPISEEDCNLERASGRFEREHVARVLVRAHGNREHAARLLGLSPATLYRYLQRLGLKGFRVDAPGEPCAHRDGAAATRTAATRTTE